MDLELQSNVQIYTTQGKNKMERTKTRTGDKTLTMLL